jgi:hypothetical protein
MPDLSKSLGRGMGAPELACEDVSMKSQSIEYYLAAYSSNSERSCWLKRAPDAQRVRGTSGGSVTGVVYLQDIIPGI